MYILRLDEITKENKKVGGKGANLGEMVKAGLPIPPGFVVTTESYDKFVKENRLGKKLINLAESIDPEDPKTIEKASKEIKTLIMGGRIPKDVEKAIKDAYDELSVGREVKKLGGLALDFVKAGRETFVAVRSSATAEDLATASFAGQMKTFLNVKGTGDLLEKVKLCWASLFTPRAIFYRKEQGVEAAPSMGVIVQKMVNSEKSGVIFTVNPMTNDRSQIMIEGAWGLGESVVSGTVVPDVYVVEKETGRLLSKTISKKRSYRYMDPSTGKNVERPVPSDKVEAQLLNEAEVAKLYELAKKVEEHYGGKPQDIEWCEERSRIFFVQTRPVTTLEREVPTGPALEEVGPAVVSGLGASPGVATGIVKVVHELKDLDKIQKGDILVARMTNPDFVQYMRKASAIVTDEGGHTSHAAIVSRELGVPCVVGTGNATTTLQDGQEVTVDAVRGKVYSGKKEVEEEAAPEVPLPEGEEAPVVGSGVTATEIKANIAFPETAEKVADRVDGVGLLRAEHMLTESGKHPVYLAKENPEELINIIVSGVEKIAKVFHPKPVWYRTLDARTDEFRQLEGGEQEPQEANPMLGWHGIRRSVEEPDVFKCEVEAIKRVHEKGLTNVAIMLPFIIKVEEFTKAKEFIDFPVKVGIMVETPASVMVIEDFCKAGIDFVSIGSNDLTQLVLGVDRGNTRLAHIYSELDPSVLRMIELTVKTCNKYKVPSSICGEAGSNPKMAEKLVEFGIDSISCEMDAIDKIRSTVARVEKRLLLEKIRNRQ